MCTFLEFSINSLLLIPLRSIRKFACANINKHCVLSSNPFICFHTPKKEVLVLCQLHIQVYHQSLVPFRPHKFGTYGTPFFARLLGRFSPKRSFVSLISLWGSFHSFLPAIFVKDTLKYCRLALLLPLATTSRPFSKFNFLTIKKLQFVARLIFC